MRAVSLAIGLILASAVTVSAQQIRLRAIEQPTLSRLSLPLGGAEFDFSKVAPRQFELLVQQPGLRFDTRQVFPDRLVSRVISARQVKDPEGSRLRFILNCDCQAQTEVSKGALLIEFFDLSEEEQAASTEPEQPVSPAVDLSASLEIGTLASAEPAETTEDVGGGINVADNGAPAPQRAPLPVPNPRSGPRPEAQSGIAGSAAPARTNADAAEASTGVVLADEPSNPPDPDQADEIRLARDKLLEQLTRAAEQGLLEFASPDDRPAESEGAASDLSLEGPGDYSGEAAFNPEDGPLPSGPETTEAPQSNLPRRPLELPVRARTAVDRDFVAGRKDTIASVETCAADQLLSGIDWLNPKDPARALAALRGEILGEFDQPRPEIIERLVVLYISLGFGIEARKLLELYGEAVPDRRLFEDLASIVDGEPITWGEGVAQNGPCSGTVALWLAAAGMRDLAEFKTEETDPALIDAFAVMPLTMRKLLGPRVLTNAVDEGNTELARRIDQLLQRSGGELGPAQNLALARLISLDGRPEAAEAIYTRIAASRSELATEALLRLVESKLKRGAPVSEIERQELAFAAFVYRADPKGRDLRLTDLQARAGGPGLPAVLSEIKRHLQEAPNEGAEYRDIGHLLLEESTRDEVGDAAYAQAVLSYVDEISPTAAGDAARARVARELTAAGLANLAFDVLNVALARRQPDVRLAAAEALVALDRPDEALLWLEGLSGPEAVEVTIRAHQARQTPAEALPLATADGDPAQDRGLANLAWQAGVWEAAVEQGPEARRLLAAFMAGRDTTGDELDPERGQAFLAPPELPPDASLQSSKQVLDGSTTVRKIIEEALGDG